MSTLTKSDIRKAALARRDATDPLWRAAIAKKLATFADRLSIQTGAIVSSFNPIRSEIDIRPLADGLAKTGHAICLPVVLNRETIVFRQIVEGAAMVDTGFGTIGPDAKALTVDPDVMLMPLAAFDGDGNRIGYGAGHYDRAIARLAAVGKKPLLIGCAFECQRVISIPAQAHDVPLDAILTEAGLRHFAFN